MKQKAIINAHIYTMAARSGKAMKTKVPEEIKKGTIIIEDGKIKAIGEASKVKVPKDAEVIDAKGKLVLPGFVDAHSHMGMWEQSIGFEGSDGNEMTDPVTPHLRAIDAVYPMDTQFGECREGGGDGSCNRTGFCQRNRRHLRGH